GRVDSPPMSRMWAPCSTSSKPCAIAAPESRYSPPSENESGVTLTIPMSRWPDMATSLCAPSLGGREAAPTSGQGRRLRVGAAHIRGASGQPGARQRTWGFTAGAIGRRGRDRQLGRGWLLSAEDFLLVLAVEQCLELLLLDRLALDEDLGDLCQVVFVLGEDRLGAMVGRLDDAAHLVVDLARDLIGVVGLGGELPAEEGLAMLVAEHARPQLVGHAETHDHLLGGGGHLLQVIGSAGGNLVEDDLLGGAATQGHRHRVVELGTGCQEAVFLGHRDRVAQGLTA